MSIKEEVTRYLEQEPKFRERSNKDRGFVNLLVKRYQQLKDIPKETLIAAIQDYASMDRSWRQTLELNPRLRGSDYEDKAELEKLKQQELGYRVK